MRTLRVGGILGSALLAAQFPAVGGLWPQATRAEASGRDDSAPASIEAIDAEFQEGIRALEARRLTRLAELAAAQQGPEADLTLETYLRTALDAELFAEAEPIAERILASGQSPAVVTWLAHVVNIFAEAERGEYRESLDNLIAVIQAGDERADAAPTLPVLPLEARLKLEEAYFQRLIHADQYAIAREAFTLLSNSARDPALREHAASRLRQIELVGQPAPEIRGNGVDGQPVDLADYRGDVVLVVFWASWCLPNAQQAERIDRIMAMYGDQGFRVVGVNVDALDESIENAESVLPAVRRYLLDYNITWPNVLDVPGDTTIAGAYGVTDLPTSVLIGRDGVIRGLAMTGEQLERKVDEAVQEPKP